MKRVFLWILCIILLLTPAADAALGNKGLTLEGGTAEIVIAKGEKRRLRVRDGLTGLPVWNGLSCYSDNTIIVGIGLHSGVLRGNQVGTATVTVMHRSGRSARIRVRVISSKGTAYLPLLLLLCLMTTGLILWVCRHGSRSH